MKPLCVDLFAGLGGWAEGFLAEGFNVVGFDVERHSTQVERFARPCGEGWETASTKTKYYPSQLVLQDVLTIHGSQFRDAALIVASPPCQNYSYLAMPWSRSKDPNNSKAAKALRLRWETEGPDNRLFDACFRIREEAMEATRELCIECDGSGMTGPERGCFACTGRGLGPPRYIPLIVENVRGAQPWVGRSAWNYGSFHLWADVPALMPITLREGLKCGGRGMKEAREKNTLADDFFNTPHELRSQKAMRGNSNGGHGIWFERDESGLNKRDRAAVAGIQNSEDGTKIGGDWFSDPNSTCRKHGSRSNARKAASAQIAKIPFNLASHIARVYYPRTLDQGLRPQAAEGKS